MNEIKLEMEPFKFKDVTAEYDDKTLCFSNDFFTRKIDLSEGMPRTKLLVNKISGVQFAGGQELFDFSFAGYNFPGAEVKVDYKILDVNARSVASSWRDAEHVRIDLHIREEIQHLEFVRCFFVYPGQPFMAARCGVKCPVSPNNYWSRRALSGQDFRPENPESRIETLRLKPELKAVKSVSFRGRTDTTNDLVTEHFDLKEYAEGNLLFCESGKSGLFFLQEAPPSAERRDLEEHDFFISADNTVSSCCWGVAPYEVRSDEFLYSYRTVIGFYPLSQEQVILKRYLRLRFPDAVENYTVTVNPWGCGRFPELVNEQFLMNELKAAGEIHATHYQIDDGWQKGRALQELSLNNRHIQREFWDISEEQLPNGLDNLVNFARKNNVETALWVAPSYNCEYRDWQDFSEILFDFYKKYNIKMFKIDAVKIRTKEAEDNLEMIFKTLRERSNGEIFFNHDTTNGQRPGYFMFLEYGNIFLENRYLHRKAKLPYHPESTLKNLWNLAKYVRPQVLQIEVPNPHIIDYSAYEENQLFAPDVYPPEYWFAIAMFANPLMWLAPSQLPENIKKTFRELIDLHLKFRQQIFEGEVYPIGNEPDGKSITGFISINADGTKGFILLFRELEAAESAKFDIPFINGEISFEKIAGQDGHINYSESGGAEVKIEKPASFILVLSTRL